MWGLTVPWAVEIEDNVSNQRCKIFDVCLSMVHSLGTLNGSAKLKAWIDVIATGFLD